MLATLHNTVTSLYDQAHGIQISAQFKQKILTLPLQSSQVLGIPSRMHQSLKKLSCCPPIFARSKMAFLIAGLSTQQFLISQSNLAKSKELDKIRPSSV